mmetsp:Transcript_6742/g.21751  ORF Transcript_6742/g.21751 Transcript_6742/m.21751 type:complete len:280 (+) Transcript_6742:97-936(+)
MNRNGSLESHKSHVSHIIAHRREVVNDTLVREKLLAEFVGTFFLVLTVGTAAVGSGGPMAPVAIGLVLAVQIYTFGAVSGGFFNPAVTLAVVLAGRHKITPKAAALYVAVQCLGAVAAGLLALSATGKSFCFDYALTRGWGASLELELLFTAALCGTVLAAGTSNDAPNHYFGFAIGLTVTGGALASGGFDQGSLNPAVTLGINVANYANGQGPAGPSAGAWALFLLAPLAGGVLAAGIFRGTRGNEFAVAGQVEATAAKPSPEQQAEAVPGMTTKAEV